jgi:spore coat protein A
MAPRGTREAHRGTPGGNGIVRHELSRRDLVKSLLSAPLILVPRRLAGATNGRPWLDVRRQQQFVNRLPRPSRATPQPGTRHYEIAIRQFRGWLGLADPETGQRLETTLWGYDGQYPGPTFEARRGEPVTVRWTNALTVDGQPLPHLLPVDRSIHMAHTPAGATAGVPIVTHLHGGHVEAASDGYPEAWFTPGFAERGPAFAKEIYEYANDQEAATLWYHDHALGLTRLNVAAGLAGFYLIRDDAEERLGLPAGPHEIPLVIQDRTFAADGSLHIDTRSEVAGAPGESILPEQFGTAILVNGMLWPFEAVEPRRYRLRVLNGSDSRFYALSFQPSLPFALIGSDGGLLDRPVPLWRLLLAPGERADVVVDFSRARGRQVLLRNTAPAPFPGGKAPDPRTTGRVMAFRVGARTVTDGRRLPDRLRPSPLPRLQPTAPARRLVLFEGKDAYGRTRALLGTVDRGGLTWHDPVTEDPHLHAVEIWELHNATEDTHPVHLHLVQFQVLGHRRFKAEVEDSGALRAVRWLEKERPPLPEERGFKDTVRVPPGVCTRIVARFDRPGLYVWHCHILSHEDHEMMRPYVVRAP